MKTHQHTTDSGWGSDSSLHTCNTCGAMWCCMCETDVELHDEISSMPLCVDCGGTDWPLGRPRLQALF